MHRFVNKLGLIPFKIRIYRNKKYFFPFFFKIKINRSDAMLDFSFLNKEKNYHFLYSNTKHQNNIVQFA